MDAEFELELKDGGGTVVFEWDADKAAANHRKHRILFEEAVTIFQDEVFILEDNRARGERRYISFGLLDDARDPPVVICVVYTERDENRRIISARKALSHERKRFHEHFQRTHR